MPERQKTNTYNYHKVVDNYLKGSKCFPLCKKVNNGQLLDSFVLKKTVLLNIPYVNWKENLLLFIIMYIFIHVWKVLVLTKKCLLCGDVLFQERSVATKYSVTCSLQSAFFNKTCACFITMYETKGKNWQLLILTSLRDIYIFITVFKTRLYKFFFESPY